MTFLAGDQGEGSKGKQMNHVIVMVSMLMSLAGACLAQATSAPASSSKPSDKVLKLPGITVDLAKRQIVVDSAVCQRKNPLELLLCRWDTKERESILHTKATAANLHAALLALGLTQGIPAQWSGDDENAKFVPPHGAELKITLRWKDADGKSREADPSEWLATGEKRKAVPPKNWVFVGSSITPSGVYLADHPDYGHVISVSNFPDTVIDVPFESTSSDELLEFVPNTDKIPPMGTAVEVVIAPVKDAENSPYARATVNIDRFGQASVEGKALSGDKLTEWANEFSDKHNRAEAVIRADGRAMVVDVQTVRGALRLGGIRSFREEYVSLPKAVLPRTAGQVKDALSGWADKFAHPRDYIVEPAEEAADDLKDIAVEMRNLDSAKELLRDYASQLGKALEQYKASTQPAMK